MSSSDNCNCPNGSYGKKHRPDCPIRNTTYQAGKEPEVAARPEDDPINVRWRKKPIVIEAVRVTAADFNGYNFDGSPFTAVPLWLQEAIEAGKVHVVPDDRDYAMWGIRTLEGVMQAGPGDWIIRGVKGELYPCKNDIFEATYEPA